MKKVLFILFSILLTAAVIAFPDVYYQKKDASLSRYSRPFTYSFRESENATLSKHISLLNDMEYICGNVPEAEIINRSDDRTFSHVYDEFQKNARKEISGSTAFEQIAEKDEIIFHSRKEIPIIGTIQDEALSFYVTLYYYETLNTYGYLIYDTDFKELLIGCQIPYPQDPSIGYDAEDNAACSENSLFYYALTPEAANRLLLFSVL